MEDNKLNALNSKINAFVIKSKTAGAAYITLSAIFACLATIKFYKAGKLEGVMEASEAMIEVFAGNTVKISNEET